MSELKVSEQPSRQDIMEELSGMTTEFVAPVVKRGQLTFTIGLQRSGKSTWATNWMRSNPRQEDGIIFPRAVVCADNIRLAVSGQRYNKDAEPTVFMIKDYMIEALLARSNDVLCDGTHTTITSIRRQFEIDINAKYKVFDTPKAECMRRAIKTGHLDLAHALDRTEGQLKELLDQGVENVCEEIRKQVRARWPTTEKYF